MTRDLATLAYWRAAHVARHPVPAFAMQGAATLWDLVLTKAPELAAVRAAAHRHLQVLGHAPRQEVSA